MAEAPVYSLFWDMDHLGQGYDRDATLQPFDGWEHIAGWQLAREIDVPTPVLFEANFDATSRSDYPCNDVGWPLMSSRMLEVVRRLGSFPHRVIPVRLLDRSALGPCRFLPDGSLRPEVFDDRFAAIQLTEHVDVVDWDRSEYRPSSFNPNKVSGFRKLMFIEPAGGFPPLFRLAADTSYLLVSAEARRALEEAGIRGVQFMDLPGWYIPERD